MSTGEGDTLNPQAINEVGTPSAAFHWLSTARPHNPAQGDFGFATDTGAFEVYIGTSWLHPVWINASSNTFTGAMTVQGLLTAQAGITFSGGTFANGQITTDSNWGAWIEGRAGAQADFALANSGSTALIRGKSTNVIQTYPALQVGNNETITWSGTALLPPNLAFMSYATWAGTLPVGTSSMNGQPLNLFQVSENIIMGTNVDAIHYLTVNGAQGTAGTGSRVGLYSRMVVQSLTGSKVAAVNNPAFIASGCLLAITANQGGTAQTNAAAYHNVFGDVRVIRLGASASYFRDMVGLEIDLISQPVQASAPLRKVGIQIVGYDDTAFVDISRGAIIDAGLLFGESGSLAPGFLNGIMFGQGNNGDNITSTGRYIASYAAMPEGVIPTLHVAKDGIYLNETTFSGDVLRSKLVKITGSGSFGVYTGLMSATATGVALDANGSVGTAEGGTLAMGGTSTGGTGWLIDEIAYDAYGGMYYVSAVSGTAVTQLTVLRQPVVNGAAPSNPVALTSRAGTTGVSASLGTGLAADMTWTAKPTLAIQDSGGQVYVRGPATVYQSAHTAKTTSDLLTAAQLLTGIIVGNQGAGAPAAYQLPTGTNFEAAFSAISTSDSWHWSMVNDSTNVLEYITISTNTGWTIYGGEQIDAKGSLNGSSSGRRLIARRTAANTFSLYFT